MRDPAILVFDASAGVKWFRAERGADEALGALARSAAGEIEIVVPVHFFHEVLSVVGRSYGPEGIVPAWNRMKDSGVRVIGLTDEVVEETAAQCESLGCSFYDALAPAVARLLGATLMTADARAHGGFPGVQLIE